MNRCILLLILSLMSALGLQARETVRGTVVDGHGDPVPGVKVEIPGSSEFVYTDLDGAFQLILREPVKKLNFTYPGFGTRTQRVAPEMRVTLSKGWAGREKGSRCMIDLEGGTGIGGKATFISGTNKIKDFKTLVLTGLTFTAGYQFNKHLFVGLGLGGYLDITQYQEISGDYSNYYESYRFYEWKSSDLTNITIPVYIAARWDFGLNKKTAPYIGLRFGMAPNVCVGHYIGEAYSYDYDNRTSLTLTQEFSGSLFVTPSVGYRMSVYRKFGINLGLSYMFVRRKHFFVDYYGHNNSTGYSGSQDFYQRVSDALLFNIGFDF